MNIAMYNDRFNNIQSLEQNLFQLFHNTNKDKKLPIGKTTMVEIKVTCKYDDLFYNPAF